MRQPSLPLKVMCQQQSTVIAGEKIPLHSRPPFYLARALKNNHPGHGPLLPIISLIYPHLSLHFPFSSLNRSSISSAFNCLCPSCCFALAMFCFLLLFFFALFLYATIAFFFSFHFMQGSFLPNVKTAYCILSSFRLIFIIQLLHFIC